MTKLQEVAKLDQIIASLEDGYLRDILSNSRDAIETAIRNDFTHGVIGEQMAESVRLDSEIKAKQAELAALAAAKDKLSKTVQLHEEAIRVIKSEARRIAGI